MEYQLNIEKFEQLAKNSIRTQKELINLMNNALNNGHREHANIVKDQLDKRFPNWNSPKKVGGPTPTTAIFCGDRMDFKSGKEAYIWLIEKLIAVKPNIFSSQEKWHARVFKGSKRYYFAKEPNGLFPENIDLAESAANVEKLSSGWFANINLSHNEKFKILIGLAAICGFHYPSDIDFIVTGSSKSLIESQEMVRLSNQLFNELENL